MASLQIAMIDLQSYLAILAQTMFFQQSLKPLLEN